MTICGACGHREQLGAAFCPNCGAALSTLAARLRDSRQNLQISVISAPAGEAVAVELQP